MAVRTRYACMDCGKRFCSQPHTLCKGCDLQARIEALPDLEDIRAKLVAHCEKHKHPKSKNRLAGSAKHKLFIATRKFSKPGEPWPWFELGDVSLAYPVRTSEVRRNKKTRKYENIEVVKLSAYSFRFYDLGNHGKPAIGFCQVPANLAHWLEGPYGEMIAELHKNGVA